MSRPKLSCSLCAAPVDGRSLRSPQKLENRIIDLIKQDRPDWEANRGICPNCLEQYRAKHDLQLASPRVALVDLSYHDITRSRSLYAMLAKRGLIERLVLSP